MIDSGNQILLLLLIVVLVGTFVYQMFRTRVAEPRRSNDIHKVIADEGWQLHATAPRSLVEAYGHFPYVTNSAAKEVRNLISGDVEGTQFVAFDYQFLKKVHGAFRRSSQTETVIIVDTEEGNLPVFALVEPNTLEPPLQGYQVFETAGLRRIEGVDEQAVRSLLTDEVISQAPAFNIQGQGEQLLFYRTWRRSNPSDLIQEIRHCVAFAQRLSMVDGAGVQLHKAHEFAV